jgi:uncharacterized small protein (DUF1192 family)
MSNEQSIRALYDDIQNKMVALEAEIQDCINAEHSNTMALAELYRFFAWLQSEMNRLVTEVNAKTAKFAKSDLKDTYSLETIHGVLTGLEKQETPEEHAETVEYFATHADSQEVSEIVSALNPQLITDGELERAKKRAEQNPRDQQ